MEQTLRVLIIEDNADDYLLTVRELKRLNGYKIESEQVSDERSIREALTDKSWDLIICDYFLLGFDAPRVMVLLEHLGVDVPFVLMSGHISQEVAEVALRMGAHEYVEKGKFGKLAPVIRRELKLFSAYDENLRAWGKMLEVRDFETKGHTERVVELAVNLATKLGVSAPDIRHIRRGAYLHDIGKLAIPDSILLKKGPLTDEEMGVMRGHSVIGYEMVRGQEFLKRSLEIPLLHHEKWNGTGYPYGLQGEAIPLAARIFAVVDVYDALVSDRPYHEAAAGSVALEYIKAEKGIAFDPKVVEVFVGMFDDTEVSNVT